MAALVARDRREPGFRLVGAAPVEQAPIGGEERLLRGVFRLDAVPQDQAAERIDHAAVRLEQLAGAGTGIGR